MHIRRIFLIGYMGAGKTTLGKAYAREYGLSFIDLDWYIEERFHRSVREIYETEGNDKFREIERRMLHEVADFENVLISTGGGTPCYFDNLTYMKERGQTVFLDVNEDVIFSRLSVARRQRPTIARLNDEELRVFIHKGIEERRDVYSKAEFTFDGSMLETKQQVKVSVEELNELLR